MKLFKNVEIESGKKKPKLVKKVVKEEPTPIVEESIVEDTPAEEPVKEITETSIPVQNEVVGEVEKPAEVKAEITENNVKSIKDQVEDFICEFFKDDSSGKMIDTFANEKSYWFAFILFQRFQELGPVVMYDTVADLFYLLLAGKFYNSYGEVEYRVEKPVSFNTWIAFQSEEVRRDITKKHLYMGLDTM